MSLWIWTGLAIHQETVWEGTLPAVPTPGQTIRLPAASGTDEDLLWRVVDEDTGVYAPVEWQVARDGTLTRVRIHVG